jgi:hypothetical protein
MKERRPLGFSGLLAAQKRTEVIAEYQKRRQPQNSSAEQHRAMKVLSHHE